MNSTLSKNSQYLANKLLGCKYEVNGTDPNGFDCWGLAWYVLTESGFNIPNKYDYVLRSNPRDLINLTEQAKSDPNWIKLDKPEPLCLVGFAQGKAVTHVGIWLGLEDKVLHATTQFGVTCETLTNIERTRNLTSNFYKWQNSIQ